MIIRDILAQNGNNLRLDTNVSVCIKLEFPYPLPTNDDEKQSMITRHERLPISRASWMCAGGCSELTLVIEHKDIEEYLRHRAKQILIAQAEDILGIAKPKEPTEPITP